MMQSLFWILTKLYNEVPPRTLWNYVLRMRHHDEISPRDSWNYILTEWGTTTKQSLNYVLTTPTSCSINQYRIIVYTIFITNQPIHVICQDHVKLINSSPYTIQYMQIHSFHALTSQSNKNMWQTPKNKEENRSWPHSHPDLAQAERPHSCERFPLLRRAPFA